MVTTSVQSFLSLLILTREGHSHCFSMIWEARFHLVRFEGEFRLYNLRNWWSWLALNERTRVSRRALYCCSYSGVRGGACPEGLQRSRSTSVICWLEDAICSRYSSNFVSSKRFLRGSPFSDSSSFVVNFLGPFFFRVLAVELDFDVSAIDSVGVAAAELVLAEASAREVRARNALCRERKHVE